MRIFVSSWHNYEYISETDFLEISECFKLFDANGSGIISANKLYIAVSELGLNFLQDEVDELMNAVDERGGWISLKVTPCNMCFLVYLYFLMFIFVTEFKNQIRFVVTSFLISSCFHISSL